MFPPYVLSSDFKLGTNEIYQLLEKGRHTCTVLPNFDLD